ncbi:ComEC/Rec2 family competence protein [Rubeoparvulum massiliense]|uniref:ComEC/Rec2 family competence protein n=1 Tax=Rubeoparvulum massiliense TaxID=1631346 RepID=UPI00065E243E|nr:hypothetical protein [Rubeoparvulum massiliense]
MLHRFLQFFILFSMLFMLFACGTIDEHMAVPAEYQTRILTEEEVRRALQIHFLPIAEQETMVIQFPDRRVVLVDSGTMEHWKEVEEQLKQLGIKKIHDLFIPLPTIKRMELVPVLHEEYGIERVGFPSWYNATVNKIQLPSTVQMIPLQAGDHWDYEFGVSIRVLAPFPPLSRSPQNNSLVLMVERGKIELLYASSIHAERELQLIQRYELKTTDILKVSDFASIHGSHPLFIDEVDAQVGVLFFSKEVHGREEVLERLKENWFNLFETDLHGLITVLVAEDNYEVILPYQRK